MRKVGGDFLPVPVLTEQGTVALNRKRISVGWMLEIFYDEGDVTLEQYAWRKCA